MADSVAIVDRRTRTQHREYRVREVYARGAVCTTGTPTSLVEGLEKGGSQPGDGRDRRAHFASPGSTEKRWYGVRPAPYPVLPLYGVAVKPIRKARGSGVDLPAGSVTTRPSVVAPRDPLGMTEQIHAGDGRGLLPARACERAATIRLDSGQARAIAYSVSPLVVKRISRR